MGFTRSCCRLADLIELRRLRKSRQGIDASKLNKGDVKKKRRRPKDEEEPDQGGLKPGSSNAARKEVVEEDEYVVAILVHFYSLLNCHPDFSGMKTTKMHKPGGLCGITTSRSRPMLSTSTNTCKKLHILSPQNKTQPLMSQDGLHRGEFENSKQTS